MKIFIADKIAAEGVAYLMEHTNHQIDFSPGLPPEQVCEHIRGADAVIVRSATNIRDKVLDAAENLKVIGRAGIGTDNIDVTTATERGIVIVNTPDANATTTAELAIAHILSLCRHLPDADQSVRRGKWERSRFNGTEITGKTLAIIGFGTIGRIVANRALGLKMRVIAYDPYVTANVFADADVENMDIETLLPVADIITLHCPLIDKTRNLLNADRISRMKPGARLVNCARGGLVDESALYEALKNGHLAGAALDVFTNEPPKDSPLFSLNNIVFTPHLGASTEEAQTAVGIGIAKQVAAFLKDGEAINAVNLPRIPAGEAARLKPWQELARSMGRLLALMATEAINHMEISLTGRIADLKPQPITAEALVGLLGEQLSVTVNQVNSAFLAKRQGITISETRSSESHDYLSLIKLTAGFNHDRITLAGTLFDERRPRLVRINNYQIEASLKGKLLFTRHNDQPGVVRDIGTILASRNINISNMQVGTAEGAGKAVAIIGISDMLDEETLSEIRALPAVSKVLQVNL